MRREGSAFMTIKPFEAFLGVPSKETWSKGRLQLLSNCIFFSLSRKNIERIFLVISLRVYPKSHFQLTPPSKVTECKGQGVVFSRPDPTR